MWKGETNVLGIERWENGGWQGKRGGHAGKKKRRPLRKAKKKKVLTHPSKKTNNLITYSEKTGERMWI